MRNSRTANRNNGRNNTDVCYERTHESQFRMRTVNCKCIQENAVNNLPTIIIVVIETFFLSMKKKPNAYEINEFKKP